MAQSGSMKLVHIILGASILAVVLVIVLVF
jgi:hypothetical protein